MVLRAVATLLQDPQLLAGVDVSLEAGVVLANNSLDRVIVAIADVVGSLWNPRWALDIVCDKSESIRSETLEVLSVELTIVVCAVLPGF